MYIGEEEGYALSAILSSILVEDDADQADAGDFPNNIQEFFWVRCGENDGDDWICCGILTNGAYFLYKGGCDYTGFDCQGGMELWVSKRWQNIVDHAMDEETYRLYQMINDTETSEKDTEEAEEEDEDTYKGYGKTCPLCGDDEATMPDEFDTSENRYICADCFWEKDAELKRKRRADPIWRANRAYSAAKVLLGLNLTEALAVAANSVANMNQ